MTIIRELPEEKWADYRDLRLMALKQEPEAFGSSYEEEINLPETEWRKRTHNALFATEGSLIVGMIGVIFGNRIKTGHVASIVSFFVLPEYRKRGIGKELLEAAIGRARGNPQVLKVELFVNPVQAQAVRLYEKNGFRTAGLMTGQLKVAGKLYDELYMEKFFQQNSRLSN